MLPTPARRRSQGKSCWRTCKAGPLRISPLSLGWRRMHHNTAINPPRLCPNTNTGFPCGLADDAVEDSGRDRRCTHRTSESSSAARRTCHVREGPSPRPRSRGGPGPRPSARNGRHARQSRGPAAPRPAARRRAASAARTAANRRGPERNLQAKERFLLNDLARFSRRTEAQRASEDCVFQELRPTILACGQSGFYI